MYHISSTLLPLDSRILSFVNRVSTIGARRHSVGASTTLSHIRRFRLHRSSTTIRHITTVKRSHLEPRHDSTNQSIVTELRPKWKIGAYLLLLHIRFIIDTVLFSPSILVLCNNLGPTSIRNYLGVPYVVVFHQDGIVQ